MSDIEGGSIAMQVVRITVMKMASYQDLMEQFENPIEDACPMRVGQVFIARGGQRPQGMCDDGWKSMEPFVAELAQGGGDFYDGWMKNPHSAMVSCNDGFRPVSFLVETVEEDG